MPRALTLPLMLLAIAACSPTLTTDIATDTGSATAAKICDEIGQSLPTRSRSDTQQTRDEITEAYAVFVAVCPNHEHLIPK
ncbi:hypothetical protein [Actibacterium sp.]|uniref:hypothetical protein n=1 Tax=Actibacterium sp. TaxID=1872125 RepID=UPI00356A8F7B